MGIAELELMLIIIVVYDSMRKSSERRLRDFVVLSCSKELISSGISIESEPAFLTELIGQKFLDFREFADSEVSGFLTVILAFRWPISIAQRGRDLMINMALREAYCGNVTCPLALEAYCKEFLTLAD